MAYIILDYKQIAIKNIYKCLFNPFNKRNQCLTFKVVSIYNNIQYASFKLFTCVIKTMC